jgi:hypothetical protein
VIYRLDISRQGISSSQASFKPSDIANWYIGREIARQEPPEGTLGYKEVDDMREGFVSVEGMVKIRGPQELGGQLGTIEFNAIVNSETGAVLDIKKAELRVMGKRVVD